MRVILDTGEGKDRRISAEVESNSELRQWRYGSYVVDLVQGEWRCTCWNKQPCRHVKEVRFRLRLWDGRSPL